MAIQLECLQGPHAGRQLPVKPDKPLIIRTQKSDQAIGEVQVELRDGLCVLTNRSRMTCAVNGKERDEAVLADGDRVSIGKQVFKLVMMEDADESTEHVVPARQGVDAAAERAVCSVCDARFDHDDARYGWTDGQRRICRACLSKGVGPEHLPRPAAPPPGAEPAALADLELADLELAVDEPQLSPLASTTTAPPPPAPADSSESDRVRRSRRISASRLAQVDAAPKSEGRGLLERVGSVFTGKSDDRKQLEALEAERIELLLDAGRASLLGNGGFGLADNAMAVLVQGAALTVRQTDLGSQQLEQWRAMRQRLRLLDAEIAALRKRMKLNADPMTTRKAPTLPPLRTDQIAREERAFQALDDFGTEDLDAPEPRLATPATPPAALPAAARRAPAKPSGTKPAPRQAATAQEKRLTQSHVLATPRPAAEPAAAAKPAGQGASGDAARRKISRRRR